MNRKTKILLCVFAALLALAVTVYPLVSNYTAEKYRSLIETRYNKAIEKLDTSELDAARKAAQEYNEALLASEEEPYTKAALAKAAENYDDLLNVQGDGLMGYVDIPAIHVNLPIYHGTEEDTLERGTGHLLGSSLPVGGKGCHTVITGHSGLAGQKIFSDLDQLQIGDVFYLRVLGETYAYMVLEINKVLPEDSSKLTANPSLDSCTLLTCTPYGVNTHRLLVRGSRIEVPTAERIEERHEAAGTETASTWTGEYLHGIAYGILGIAAAFLIIQTAQAGIALRREKKAPRPTRERRTKPSVQAQRKKGKHEAQ